MKKIRVLIVEDNEMLAGLLKKVCEQNLALHEIVSAATLKEAKAVLERGFVPNLVISDGSLPDGLGPTLFGSYREMNPRVFIIFSSSLPRESAMRMLPEHDRNFYRPKPIFPNDIALILREIESE